MGAGTTARWGVCGRADPKTQRAVSQRCPRCSIAGCLGLVPSEAVCRHLPPLLVRQPQGKKENGTGEAG